MASRPLALVIIITIPWVALVIWVICVTSSEAHVTQTNESFYPRDGVSIDVCAPYHEPTALAWLHTQSILFVGQALSTPLNPHTPKTSHHALCASECAMCLCILASSSSISMWEENIFSICLFSHLLGYWFEIENEGVWECLTWARPFGVKWCSQNSTPPLKPLWSVVILSWLNWMKDEIKQQLYQIVSPSLHVYAI